MKKFIFKILVFTCLLTLVFMGLNRLFTPFNFFEKTMTEYKDDEGALDVAIFGSSHAYHSFDVRVIEDQLNLKVFNFGGTAQRLVTTNVIMNKVIEENDLKLIIVDIFSMSIASMENENSRHLQLETLDYLPLSFNKVEQTSVIFDNGYLPFALFPFLRRHSEWKKIQFVDFSGEDNLLNNRSFYNGFHATSKTFTNKTWKEFEDKYKDITEDKSFKSLSNSQKKKIDGIVKIASDKGVPILFTNSPSYVSSHNINYRKTTEFIKRYLMEKDIPFVDFDEMRVAKKINKPDFQDPNHLNPKGALIVTDSLASYVAQNYHFERDKESALIFRKNKFYQIKHHFKRAAIHKTLDVETAKATKINEVAIIRSSEGRAELIIQTDDKKTIPIKFEFDLSDTQSMELFLKDEMYIKGKKYFNWGKLNQFTSFKYNGKNYKSYQIYYPFHKIKRLKIYSGSDPKVKILDEQDIEI